LRDRHQGWLDEVKAVNEREDPGAAQLSMAAIDAAQRSGSARIIGELHTLESELAARPDRAETHAFHEALTQTTLTPA
jgi:hypothetical protein